MRRNLTIDRGNTATKAVVWEGRRAIWQQSYPDAVREDFCNIVEKYSPECAILCTVTDGNEFILETLTELLGEENVKVLTREMPIPMEIDYSTPETLGADRVAAAVGATVINPGKTSLVVDIGTAITYDVVTADCHFRGGNIAPGIGMRLRALNAYTSRLPLIDRKGETPLWGESTDTAMRSGAVNGVIGEILYYMSQLPADTTLILTGGWGTDMAKLLPIKAVAKPCLVSIGLNRILSYNNQLQQGILTYNETK